MEHTPLYERHLVRLAPRDPERDAYAEADWSHASDLMRSVYARPLRPLSSSQVKKRYVEEGKEKDDVRMAIRTLADDRLVGFAALTQVQWSNGVATLTMGIGHPDDRGHGYGTDALALLLRYAFGEMNLFRLDAVTFEYNARAVRFLERAGFVVEVRQRQAIHRDGRRWDTLRLGLLRTDWEQQQ